MGIQPALLAVIIASGLLGLKAEAETGCVGRFANVPLEAKMSGLSRVRGRALNPAEEFLVRLDALGMKRDFISGFDYRRRTMESFESLSRSPVHEVLHTREDLSQLLFLEQLLGRKPRSEEKYAWLLARARAQAEVRRAVGGGFAPQSDNLSEIKLLELRRGFDEDTARRLLNATLR